MIIDSGITFSQSKIPLAIYREIAAHLRQVGGIEVELIPQTSSKFNYMDSQISGLRLIFIEKLGDSQTDQIKMILDYYGAKYGSWE
jgi:hypothetical protein